MVNTHTKGELKVRGNKSEGLPYEIYNLSDNTTMAYITNLTKSGTAKGNAYHIVNCVNTHDGLIKMLNKVQGFLSVMPKLRMANMKGFDECINIDTVTQLNDEITNLLHI